MEEGVQEEEEVREEAGKEEGCKFENIERDTVRKCTQSGHNLSVETTCAMCREHLPDVSAWTGCAEHLTLSRLEDTQYPQGITQDL